MGIPSPRQPPGSEVVVVERLVPGCQLYGLGAKKPPLKNCRESFKASGGNLLNITSVMKRQRQEVMEV
ncbi:hypothetical protein J6590_102419 [Homalodisca vitripennis]|nr:hypothetical protein J6590_102419 [Homalodisca vitripennis]